MADQKFTFSLIPEGCSARMQRRAVLYRLTGGSSTGPEIVAGTQHVLDMWRARLCLLRQLGWQPDWSGRDWQFVRNCYPSFVVSRPVTRQCDMSFLCPFCYSRRLYDVWVRLCGAFGYPSPTEAEPLVPAADVDLDESPEAAFTRATDGLDLLVRVFTRDVPSKCAATDAAAITELAEFIKKTAASRSVCVNAMRARGTFVLTDFAPIENGYRMYYRELHVVDTTYVLPAMVTTTDARVETPTRTELARTIGNFCAYPAELLFGPADRLKVLLAARAGMRLFNGYGVLRKPRR